MAIALKNVGGGHLSRGWMLTAGLVLAATIGLLVTPYYFLAPLPALGALAAVCLLRFPRVAYWIVVALIPFAAFRGPLQFLLGGALLGYVAILTALRRTFPVQLRTSLWVPLAAFFVLGVLSAAVSPYRGAAVRNLAVLALGYSFLALHLYFLTPASLVSRLPRIVAGSVSLGAAMALAAYFLDLPLGAASGGGFKRGTGGALSAPALSLMILYALPLLVYLAAAGRTRTGRVAWLAVILVNLMGLVTTYSRGGALILLLVVTGLGLVYVRRFRPVHVGLLTAGAAALLLLAVFVVPESYWTRQRKLFDPADFSIGRRQSYLVVAWDSIRRNPVLGSGPGTFNQLYARSAAARHRRRKSEQDLLRKAHNTYVEVLVGNGVPGLVTFLGMAALAWFSFARAASRARRMQDEGLVLLVSTYRLAYAAVLVYMMIYSNVDNKYFILSLAVSEVICRQRSETRERSEPPWRG